MTRSITFSTLALVLLATMPAMGQENSVNPVDVKHRNDCRLAEQVIVHGQPANKRSWALSIIGSCGDRGGAAIPALWKEPPSDTAALNRLFHVTASIVDGRIFEAVFSVARDPSQPALVRLTALAVLAKYVEPHIAMDLSKLVPPSDYYPQWWSVWGWVDHPGQTVTSTPLPETAKDRIVQLVLELSGGNSDPVLRDNALALTKRFSNSFPGKLP